MLSVIEQSKLENVRINRGLVNLLGRTAMVLFGVCDDRDVEFLFQC